MFSTILSDDMSTPCAIIVGSGLAGLSAAAQLVTHNVCVRLLERAAKPGGNSIKASSGINGAPTAYQPVPEPEGAFFADTVASAGARMAGLTAEREALGRLLTGGSAGAVRWLVDEMGVDLSKVVQLGGHSYARTHRGSGPPPGFAIISALLKSLRESPLFHLQTSCTVTSVLKERSRVVGVEYMDANGNYEELHGPVIFASGGFGGDADGLLAHYRPDLAGYPSTNEPRPGTQPLLTAIGAQLIDMDAVQVHPTGFIDPGAPSSPLKFLAAELLRGEGGILLRNGTRFVNELATREHIAAAITSVPSPSPSTSPRQWPIHLVLDEATYFAARPHVDFYLAKGLMQKTTLSTLGPQALASITQYASAVAAGAPDPLGRAAYGHWRLDRPSLDAVVYVGLVTPVVHYTMGGVRVSAKSEVLDAEGKSVEGVWAAGEVVGGVHGGNRLGGSSLLECVVFGRIAGDACAAFLGRGE
ncbi:Flavocytochrome c [Lizonia empirigonia]|nr:Flavocytochrome c [Lizonia empirigonia]